MKLFNAAYFFIVDEPQLEFGLLGKEFAGLDVALYHVDVLGILVDVRKRPPSPWFLNVLLSDQNV